MKKTACLIFILTFSFFLSASFAQEYEEKAPPVGMRYIGDKGAKRVLPTDAKVYKEGSTTIIESFHQYVARKFSEIESRFVKDEDQQARLSSRLEQLKQEMDTLKKENSDLKKELKDLKAKKTSFPESPSK